MTVGSAKLKIFGRIMMKKILISGITLILMSAISVATAVTIGAEGKANAIILDNGDISRVLMEDGYSEGDVDANGRVNAQDSLLLRRCISGSIALTDNVASMAEIDCDGKLTARDSLTLRQIVAGSTTAPVVRAENATVTKVTDKGARIASSSGDTVSVKIDLENAVADCKNEGYLVIKGDLSAIADRTSLFASPISGRSATAQAAKTSVALDGLTSGGCIVPLAAVGKNITGAIVGFDIPAGTSVTVSEIFVANSLDAAKTVFADRIFTEEAATPKTLTFEGLGNSVAMRLGNMTDDDRNNTNGGMFHHFTNSKWPTVTVDENGKLYLAASSARMAHVDPFGATMMATSEDGGATWSRPTQISNTVLDDRDAGIVYLGNGKLLATYFTTSADSWLPGGANYSMLKPYSQGGQAPSWAATWSSSYQPTGGIIGVHLDLLRYIMRTDAAYDLSEGSYVIKSDDYGRTWSTSLYSLKGSNYSSDIAEELKSFRYNAPGTRVPVTSCHGPIPLSDGSVLYCGKAMDSTDLQVDHMGVYKSFDGGDTWKYLSEIPIPEGFYPNNFHELSATERDDGVIVCAIRTQDCNDKSVSPSLTVYLTYSYDGGNSFTKPVPAGKDFTGAPPHLITMDNGDIVMTYSDRTNPRCIRATVSTDGGITWSNMAAITTGFQSGDDMGYPASAALGDGTICTVSYGTNFVGGQSYEGYSSIIATRWSYSFN